MHTVLASHEIKLFCYCKHIHLKRYTMRKIRILYVLKYKKLFLMKLCVIFSIGDIILLFFLSIGTMRAMFMR